MDSNHNQIEEIKERLDIVQIVEKYVKLKQTGKNYSGLCPFHQEKTPSFIVNPVIQRYKCFGCGESGDIFNFLQKVENLDFPETLEKLAKEAGVEITKQQPNLKFKRLEDINYQATQYYYKELKKDQRAYDYVKNKRKFTDQTIKNFGIGYAPKYPKLRSIIGNKYSKQELIDSGLFTDKNGQIKEKFYDRIMFPIRSKKGVVIGFSGRILPGNDYGPKYMNSPDTPLFHKKNNLFGQYESRQEIRKNDLVIICEGQTDAIAAHQYGIKNIVAPLGTGLTSEQLQSISSLTKNILFFFDSDKAGQEAQVRAFKLASELNLYPYAASPLPYKDIDEFLQTEPDNFQKLIENKQESFSFILSNFLQNKSLSNLNDIIKTRQFLKDVLISVQDRNLHKYYISKARKLSKLEGSETKTKNTLTGNTKISPGKFLVKSNREKLEEKYVQLLIAYGKYQDEYQIQSEYFSTTLAKTLLEDINKNRELNKEVLYQKYQTQEEIRTFLENLIFEASQIPQDEEILKKELLSITKRIKREKLMEQKKDISVKIAIAEERGNSDEINTLSKQLIEVANMLKSI